MSDSEAYHYLDLLIDETADGLRSVALSADHLTLQWHALPADGLRAMHRLLQDRHGDFLEVKIGNIFHDAAVFLVRREGIISFKLASEAAGGDLMIADLSEPMIARLEDELLTAIEDWEEA